MGIVHFLIEMQGRTVDFKPSNAIALYAEESKAQKAQHIESWTTIICTLNPNSRRWPFTDKRRQDVY